MLKRKKCMKDQYVADIGDYGKYALLKAFCDVGETVGVNWYYTKRDGTEDGKFTKYLERPDEYRSFSPNVFDVLKEICETDRSIKAVEAARILSDCCYYGTEMDFNGPPALRKEQRGDWFAASLLDLEDARLIYLDPDNGLLTNEKVKKRKTAVKYVLPEEVEEYYRTGKNVVYYCHKGRRGKDAWIEYKAYMLKFLPTAHQIVLTYHKGTQRSYVFLIHPEDYQKYKCVIDQVLCSWKGIFEKEQEVNASCGEVNRFARKWRDAFKEDYDFYKIFDGPDLGEEARAVGFELDKGQSYAEAFPELTSWGEPEAFAQILSDERLTLPILGAVVFSRWRYFNHWALEHPNEEDRQWFIMAFEKLVEMTEDAL